MELSRDRETWITDPRNWGYIFYSRMKYLRYNFFWHAKSKKRWGGKLCLPLLADIRKGLKSPQADCDGKYGNTACLMYMPGKKSELIMTSWDGPGMVTSRFITFFTEGTPVLCHPSLKNGIRSHPIVLYPILWFSVPFRSHRIRSGWSCANNNGTSCELGQTQSIPLNKSLVETRTDFGVW